MLLEEGGYCLVGASCFAWRSFSLVFVRSFISVSFHLSAIDSSWGVEALVLCSSYSFVC